MKNSVKFRFGAILALMALAACSVNKENKNSEMNADTLIFATNPESVKGKLDVYTTMARATKYNVDAASQGLAKKIYNQNPNLNPKEIINNIKTGNVMKDILIGYFNNEKVTEKQLEDLKHIDYMNNCELYYLIPITIYILDKYIQNTLSTTTE